MHAKRRFGYRTAAITSSLVLNPAAVRSRYLGRSMKIDFIRRRPRSTCAR